jgi:hypothetical protein
LSVAARLVVGGARNNGETVDTKTQCEMVKDHLEKFGSITPLEALDKLGCFRLGARVFELRRSGMPIDTERFETSGGAVVAKYVLKQSKFRPMEQMGLLGVARR